MPISDRALTNSFRDNLLIGCFRAGDGDRRFFSIGFLTIVFFFAFAFERRLFLIELVESMVRVLAVFAERIDRMNERMD